MAGGSRRDAIEGSSSFLSAGGIGQLAAQLVFGRGNYGRTDYRADRIHHVATSNLASSNKSNQLYISILLAPADRRRPKTLKPFKPIRLVIGFIYFSQRLVMAVQLYPIHDQENFTKIS